MAHKISQAETEKDPDHWMEVIKKVSPSMCTGGFIHGVLEAHLAKDPDFEINKKTTDMICKDNFPEGSFGRRSCYHNLGHLLLVQTDDSIPKAIKICNTLDLYMPRYECLSGTFMENITTENLVAHGLRKQLGKWDAATARKTEKLCGEYTDLASQACWKEMSYLYFPNSVSNPHMLYQNCQRAPNQISRDECFIYGAGNIVHAPNFSQESLAELCQQLGEDHPLFKRCMTNVISSLITGTFYNLDKTVTLCNQTYSSYERDCFGVILWSLKLNIAPQTLISNVCRNMPKHITNPNCHEEPAS